MTAPDVLATCFCGRELELDLPPAPVEWWWDLYVPCDRCGERWAVAVLDDLLTAQIRTTGIGPDEVVGLHDRLVAHSLPALARRRSTDPAFVAHYVAVGQAQRRFFREDPWGRRIDRVLGWWPLRWLRWPPISLHVRLYHRLGAPEHLDPRKTFQTTGDVDLDVGFWRDVVRPRLRALFGGGAS